MNPSSSSRWLAGGVATVSARGGADGNLPALAVVAGRECIPSEVEGKLVVPEGPWAAFGLPFFFCFLFFLRGFTDVVGRGGDLRKASEG